MRLGCVPCADRRFTLISVVCGLLGFGPSGRKCHDVGRHAAAAGRVAGRVVAPLGLGDPPTCAEGVAARAGWLAAGQLGMAPASVYLERGGPGTPHTLREVVVRAVG